MTEREHDNDLLIIKDVLKRGSKSPKAFVDNKNEQDSIFGLEMSDRVR
jgi:hypothetical protein